MFETEPIDQRVDALSAKNMTPRVLATLDFVVPGERESVVGWDAPLQDVSGEPDPAKRHATSERAKALYADPSQGYQRAVWIYPSVDRAGRPPRPLSLRPGPPSALWGPRGDGSIENRWRE